MLRDASPLRDSHPCHDDIEPKPLSTTPTTHHLIVGTMIGEMLRYGTIVADRQWWD